MTDDYIKLEELLTPGSDRFYIGYSDYKPGTNFIYSNLGCGILACVCEKITNKYFPEYISVYANEKERICGIAVNRNGYQRLKENASSRKCDVWCDRLCSRDSS